MGLIMASSKSIVNNLCEGPVTATLLRFAAPLMLSGLLQAAYNLLDMFFIGRFVGSAALSGVAIGGQITNLFLMLAMSFSSSGQVLISQCVGIGDREGLRRSIGTLFTTMLIITVVITALSLLFVHQLLTVMNTPPESWGQARNFLVICLAGFIFISGFNMICAVFQGMGNSRFPMFVMMVSVGINLLLALLFVIGLKMESAGAATATVIAQGSAFFFALSYLYRHRDQFGFDFKLASLKIDRLKLTPLLKLALPRCLQSMMINLSMMFVNSQVNTYGYVASAISGIGTRLTSFVVIVSNAMNNAGSNMIGQNFGAGLHGRIKKVVGSSLIINLGYALIPISLALFAPRQIISFFDTDPAVLAMAAEYMHISIVFYITLALMGPYIAVVNGTGFASLGLVIGLLDGVAARIGFSILLAHPLGMGLDGYWLGNGLAGFVTIFICGIYYYSGRWKHREVLVKKIKPPESFDDSY